MVITRISAMLMATAVLLGGCSFTNDALLPSLGVGGTSNAAPAKPAPGSQTADLAPGSATGTFVGQKVVELRAELGRLQTAIGVEQESLQTVQSAAAQNAQTYHATVADISTKLQVGTTPGNPIVTQQWNVAQTQLQAVSNDLDKMNILANEMAGNVAFASYLMDAIHAAYGISGAVDEDHVQLRQLEEQTAQAQQQLQPMLSQLSGDIARQNAFLIGERANLAAMALAISAGQGLGPAFAGRGGFMPPVGPTAMPGSGMVSGRPLVTIRFDQPNVAYETPLYQAVRAALDRRPNAGFDVVAIPAGAGTAAQQASNAGRARSYAESVMRSLSAMGLPADRISFRAVTGLTAPTDEVRLYIR
jgi:hypothetical protein